LILGVCRGIIPEKVYWLQIALLFTYSFNSANTTTHLLMPLNPEFFGSLPGLPEIMQSFSIRWGAVMLGARLAFTALCVFIASGLVVGPGFFLKVGTKGDK
jgi:biotin transporter BioY